MHKKMNDGQIIKIVEEVLKHTAIKQKALLKLGRVERTFSTHLRDDLIPLFQTDIITVDAPYNRHGESEDDNSKRINGNPIELDIAIHQRFSDENNILAIEFETINHPKEDDIEKIKSLTLSTGDYRYQLGLFVVFGIQKRAGEILKMVWYKDGKEL